MTIADSLEADLAAQIASIHEQQIAICEFTAEVGELVATATTEAEISAVTSLLDIADALQAALDVQSAEHDAGERRLAILRWGEGASAGFLVT